MTDETTMADHGDVALMGVQLFAAIADDIKAKLRETGEWWVEVLRVGDFFPLLKGSKRQEVKITEALLQEIAANHPRLVAMNGSPRVDANHAVRLDRNGSDTKIRARVPEVKIEGDKLLALFKWTPLGIGEVLDEEAWEGPSAELAEIQDKQTGQPIGMALIGATVTSEPYINGLTSGLMPAVALSELARTHDEISSTVEAPGREKEGSNMSHLKLLSEALGQDLTEDNMVERITALKADAAKVPTLMSEIETLTSTHAEATTKIATLTAANTAATAESVLLAERVGKLEATNTKLDEEHVVEADLARGALAKAEAGTFDEPGIARKVRRAGIELYADSYGSRPDGYVTGGTTRGHNRDDRASAKPAETAGIVEPVKAESYLTVLAAREEDQSNALTAVVSNLNEKHAGEGDRLFALMLEGI